jgi:hypothetical protein
MGEESPNDKRSLGHFLARPRYANSYDSEQFEQAMVLPNHQLEHIMNKPRRAKSVDDCRARLANGLGYM